MTFIEPTRVRPGMKLVVENQLWVVTDYTHKTPGNLRSFVVVKIKNLLDGRTMEKTYRGSEVPEMADFEQRTVQFIYSDDTGYTFMDLSTYEQFTLSPEMVGFAANFLKPEAECIAGFWGVKPMTIELPPKMVFEVVDTIDDVARGNTSGNITKEATIETGLKIQVPAFVKKGDKVRVSTEDGRYIERA
jgi:elongation factor P